MNQNISLHLDSALTSIPGLQLNMLNSDLVSQYSLIFNGDWSSVTDYKKGFIIYNSMPLYIDNIPNLARFKLSGLGKIYFYSLGTSINIDELGQISKVKPLEVVSGQSLEVEELTFDTIDSTKFEIKNENNQQLKSKVKKVKISENRQIKVGKLEITEDLKMELKTSLEADELTLGTSLSGAKLLSTNPIMEIQYVFEENGIPKISVTDDMINSGLPDAITLIYNATQESNDLIDFSLWVENPQTILYGKGFNCEEWKNLIKFDSVCPTLPKEYMDMIAVCNPYEDENDEGYMALQISLNSEPTTPSTPPNSNSLTPILIGVGVVSVIGIIIGIFYFMKKKEENSNNNTLV